MKIRLIPLTLIVFSTFSFAFQDSDLDGVEDGLDRCSNTSFDKLVDQKGCASNQTAQTYRGALTLRVNNDMRSDEVYESDNTLSFFANYRYRAWDISLSNYRSTTGSNYSEDNLITEDDVYVTLGYLKTFSTSTLKLSVGSRIASDSETVTTQSTAGGGNGRFARNTTIVTQTETIDRNNDYFIGINVNYLITTKQNLFGYVGYTLSGDYDNYASFSLGTGYSVTPKLYSALSYNYTQSNYIDGDDEQSFAWFNSYYFTPSFFATAMYTYGIDDLSYDHTVSIGLGYTFQ